MNRPGKSGAPFVSDLHTTPYWLNPVRGVDLGMHRRRLLATLGTVGVGAIAGCTGFGGTTADGGDTTGGTETTAAPVTDSPEGQIPRSQLQRGAAKDAIPAITAPSFGTDWSAADAAPLLDTNDVVGVVRNGDARAYPLRILNWHEIVNDEFGGPLLVTYCPLCGSAVTAVREAGGQPTIFGVSGLLYKNDLVMYDEATESLWSQIEARAINGQLTGERLQLVPSTLTNWGEWKSNHPETTVLLPPPASTTITDAAPRDYDRDPYGGYDSNRQIGLGGNYDGPLHPKAQVLGVVRDDTPRAYPRSAVVEAGGVINDRVADTPVVVVLSARDEGTLIGYERRVEGRTLTFSWTGEGDDAALVAGDSTWDSLSGTATDGPLTGTTLPVASERSPLFFFAWQSFYPDTTVYGA